MHSYVCVCVCVCVCVWGGGGTHLTTWNSEARKMAVTRQQLAKTVIFLFKKTQLFAICNNTFSKWWESVKDGL
jgi:hypothetical protein